MQIEKLKQNNRSPKLIFVFIKSWGSVFSFRGGGCMRQIDPMLYIFPLDNYVLY